MVQISKIEELRPELLDLSLAELERRATEIEMARAAISKREAEAQRTKDIEEARSKVEQINADLVWLNSRDFLSAQVVESLTNKAGVFSPGMFIKKPRL